MSAKKYILDILFPPFCAGCAHEGAFLCDTCRSKLSMIPPSCFVCKKLTAPGARTPPGRTCPHCQKLTSLYSFLSPFLYSSDVIRNLIHALKYNRARDVHGVLSDILAEYVVYFKIELPKDAILVPIPLHKKRERKRGFNQSALIARGLGDRLGIESRADVLIRTKNTEAQVELTQERREENMRGAFLARNPEMVKGKTIILVDDVKTTGATIEQAAFAAKRAGAPRVWAITVAH